MQSKFRDHFRPFFFILLAYLFVFIAFFLPCASAQEVSKQTTLKSKTSASDLTEEKHKVDQRRQQEIMEQQKLDKAFGDDPKIHTCMREMKKEIKEHWHPAKADESYTNIITFTVMPNGYTENPKFMSQSHNIKMERDSYKALVNAEPFLCFSSLLKKYKQDNVKIEFAFDYDVSEAKPKKTKQRKRTRDLPPRMGAS